MRNVKFTKNLSLLVWFVGLSSIITSPGCSLLNPSEANDDKYDGSWSCTATSDESRTSDFTMTISDGRASGTVRVWLVSYSYPYTGTYKNVSFSGSVNGSSISCVAGSGCSGDSNISGSFSSSSRITGTYFIASMELILVGMSSVMDFCHSEGTWVGTK